jgi:hypothetical protein
MNLRSLFAVGLISLLSLSSLSAADLPSRDGQAPGGAPITLAEYWDLVSETQGAVVRMGSKSKTAIRQELDRLAAEWEQVTSVKLPDGKVVEIDPAYLTAELQKDPPQLEQLAGLLEALLRAHEDYPQNVFTLEDILPLREILKRPEFQWQAPQSAPALQMPNWLARLLDRILEFFSRLFVRTGTAMYQGRVLWQIAGVILLIVVLFFVFRSISRNLTREAQLAAGDRGNEELLTSTGALQRAETLSVQGDYRNAIRYLYLSSLLVLDEQGLLRYDRSRTNREYLRSVSSKPGLAKPLRDVIDVFDRVWYGFESVDEQTYQTYMARVDELREKKE